ncbi:MAG: winged helix-turn-helix transcriptional regulator [archaeon]
MKQVETDKRSIIMILCFVYAGISLILFLISLLVIVKNGNVISFNTYINSDIATISSQILYSISWIIGLFSLCGLVLSVFAGRELQKSNPHVNAEKEKNISDDGKTIDIDMLLPEEIKIVNVLEENDKSMTQNDLVRDSGMSKVKVHRIIKRLESKKVITKHNYGMTNRIKLEKSFRTENEE